MSTKTQRIVAYVTPEVDDKLEDVVKEYSLSKSEILRRGLLHQIRELKGGDF